MRKVTIYTKAGCSYCVAAKRLLSQKDIAYDEIDVSRDATAKSLMVARSGGRRTVPQLFTADRHLGGCDDLYALDHAGQLDAVLAS